MSNENVNIVGHYLEYKDLAEIRGLGLKGIPKYGVKNKIIGTVLETGAIFGTGLIIALTWALTFTPAAYWIFLAPVLAFLELGVCGLASYKIVKKTMYLLNMKDFKLKNPHIDTKIDSDDLQKQLQNYNSNANTISAEQQKKMNQYKQKAADEKEYLSNKASYERNTRKQTESAPVQNDSNVYDHGQKKLGTR